VRLYQAAARLSDLKAALQPQTLPVLREQFLEPISVTLLTLHVFDVLIACVQVLIEDFAKYMELIETTIDLDLVAQHEFVIRPTIDERLKGAHGPQLASSSCS
jgi:hypothetical protein